jgi:phosphoadenosine phosphosulfate reductase
LELIMSQVIEDSARLLKDYCPPEGYIVAYSGGKDSDAQVELCKLAGVPYQCVMKVTTVDPPELTAYVKNCHPDVIRLRPPCNCSMYTMMAMEKGFATRFSRWCCEEFKEYVADIERGRRLLIGVRAEESKDRAEKWGTVKACMQTGEYKIAPLYHWKTEHVWEIIKAQNAPYCSLYDEGAQRIGCIGCPLSRRAIYEFMRWPWAYVKYRNAGEMFIRRRQEAGEPFIAIWPGWPAAKKELKEMKIAGVKDRVRLARRKEIRALAARDQEAMSPDAMAGQAMSWWLRRKTTSPEMIFLENYAKEHRK